MCQVYAGQDRSRYRSTTRRVRINGQSTSIRLENAFWATLDEIATGEGVSTPTFLSKLHSEVLERQGEPENFSSLLRTTCLIYAGRSAAAAPLVIAAE
ncbi:hypothetical protein FIU97_00655 [Roseivivax sp. THAF40]|uniref:ribbon-helix-helix domain-containing protein n=1 Tax=unclassified Roseivivax TaxID=2639302 RepID=UPI001268AF47|nr:MULTISPECIES: ribbon-helix-helix domain-containing protein [unclassified Roseivivax]QFS81341.1 hypothetical protein FIV09_00740 [Roseivivax sp. THAF197b]QFT45070.1 hypothetical protein FIU97_00655 [Roseivivax sp. THAF40]